MNTLDTYKPPEPLRGPGVRRDRGAPPPGTIRDLSWPPGGLRARGQIY